MNIAFTKERWEGVKKNTDLWWRGELGRPLVQITTYDRDPGRPEPALPRQSFTAFYDMSVTPEEIVDRWDYDLSRCEFLGDAIPVAYPIFGPGVIAGFLGCDLINGMETVWFHPREIKDITQLEFKYDPDNIWLRRIKHISSAAIRHFDGLVQIGMTDLGGSLDILASFLPGERLLMELYDHPSEVKRLNWELHELWWRYFDELNAVLQPTNPGYTAWAHLFSTGPYYMLQCDFAYMLGPEMFEEFVLPELHASCRRLSNAFYHLDGPGQLPHLDYLLKLPELKGIQWIPGAGAPDFDQWPEVYRRIHESGKLIQLFGGPELLDAITEQIGDPSGIQLLCYGADRESALACLDKYGVPLE